VLNRFGDGLFPAGADISANSAHPRAVAYPNLRNRDHRKSKIASSPSSRPSAAYAMGRVDSKLALGLPLPGGCAGGRESRLPEVKLGLLPGAGGTQRPCRVYSASKPALNMIASGTTVALGEASRHTSVRCLRRRRTCLEERREALARRGECGRVGAKAPLCATVKPQHCRNAEAFFPVRAQYGQRPWRVPIPPALGPAVEAVAGGGRETLRPGSSRQERDLFHTLMLSPESAALRSCVSKPRRAASHILDVAGRHAT